MNDPIASFNAPPPRYLLESDSEDEDGEGLYSGSGPSKPRIRVAREPVAVHWEGRKTTYSHVVLGVGQAGRYLIRKLGVKREDDKMRIQRGGEVIGRGYEMDEVLVLHVEEVENDGVWEVAKAAQDGITGGAWAVITTYLPAMYIPGTSKPTSPSPPIRYLSTSPSKVELPAELERLDSPNFVSGLPAALTSLAVHPATPKSDLTVLLLPLPLSHLSVSSFSKAIAFVAPPIIGVLSASIGKPEAKWDEYDDEPYAGPGMGGRKPRKKDLSREDIGGMYM